MVSPFLLLEYNFYLFRQFVKPVLAEVQAEIAAAAGHPARAGDCEKIQVGVPGRDPAREQLKRSSIRRPLPVI